MIKRIVGLYYSPVGGTRMMTEKLVKDLAGELNRCSLEKVGFDCYDLRLTDSDDVLLDEECIAVIGTPVYMGKIPVPAAEALKKLKGKDVMTLVSVSYGGRSYGNALFELQHYAEDAGFTVIGAAAFMILCKALLREKAFDSPAIDADAIAGFEKAISGKISRLLGSEVENLKIKPAPIEAPGHMPIHRISRYSPRAAATAQHVFERLCIRKNGSEWFL